VGQCRRKAACGGGLPYCLHAAILLETTEVAGAFLLESTDVGGALRDVADPPIGVIGLMPFCDAEVPYLQVGHVVHGNLEVERNRPNLLRDGVSRAAAKLGRQIDFALQRKLCAALKLLHGP